MPTKAEKKRKLEKARYAASKQTAKLSQEVDVQREEQATDKLSVGLHPTCHPVVSCSIQGSNLSKTKEESLLRKLRRTALKPDCVATSNCSDPEKENGFPCFLEEQSSTMQHTLPNDIVISSYSVPVIEDYDADGSLSAKNPYNDSYPKTDGKCPNENQDTAKQMTFVVLEPSKTQSNTAEILAPVNLNVDNSVTAFPPKRLLHRKRTVHKFRKRRLYRKKWFVARQQKNQSTDRNQGQRDTYQGNLKFSSCKSNGAAPKCIRRFSSLNSTGNAVNNVPPVSILGKNGQPELQPSAQNIPKRNAKGKFRVTCIESGGNPSMRSKCESKLLSRVPIKRRLTMNGKSTVRLLKPNARKSDNKSAVSEIGTKRKSNLQPPVPTKKRRKINGKSTVRLLKANAKKCNNKIKDSKAGTNRKWNLLSLAANRRRNRQSTLQIPNAQDEQNVEPECESNLLSLAAEKSRHEGQGESKAPNAEGGCNAIIPDTKRIEQAESKDPNAKSECNELASNFQLRIRTHSSGPKNSEEKQSGQRDINPTFRKLNVFSATKLKKNVFKLAWTEPRLVNLLAGCCEGPRSTVKVLVKRLLKWCLLARKRLIARFSKARESIRSFCDHLLLVAKQCQSEDERREAILGISRHTSWTEAYFTESTYKPICSEAGPQSSIPRDTFLSMYRNGEVPTVAINHLPLIIDAFGKLRGINESGKRVDIFPEVSSLIKSVRWECGLLCRPIDGDKMKIVRRLILKLSQTALDRQMIYFLRGMNACKGICRQVCKSGHSLNCRLVDGDGASLVLLQNLMPHYPKLRRIVRDLQKLKSILHDIDVLDSALYELDVEKLQALADKAKKAGGEFETSLLPFPNEDDIIHKYMNSFTVLETEMSDLPTYYCLSCEKQLPKKSMQRVSGLRSVPSSVHWKHAFKRAQDRNISLEWICKFCLGKFRLDQIPAVSCLNVMEVPEVPPAIQKLSTFSKMFIQRAKAFQTVQKMGTVAGKNMPSTYLMSKVVGRTFHLPLPTEQTLAKMLQPHEAVMPNQELYVLIRGLPPANATQKTIWESKICVNDIYEALLWYKENNHLYADIQLPDRAEALLDCLIDQNPDDSAPPNPQTTRFQDPADSDDDPDDPLPLDALEDLDDLANLSGIGVLGDDRAPNDDQYLINEKIIEFEKVMESHFSQEKSCNANVSGGGKAAEIHKGSFPTETSDTPIPELIQQNKDSELHAGLEDRAQNDGQASNDVSEGAPPNVDADNGGKTADPDKGPPPSAAPDDAVRAMLTQRNEDDEFYAEYTIYPVYDRRDNKLATEMYQMLKVQGDNLDNRSRVLDAMCFPDLYPDGKNYFNEERPVKLEFMDFVKAKLTSRDPRFRLNLQYVFFLLNQVNQRQINAGIYQTINVTRDDLTKAQFYQRLKEGNMDRDMSSIFRRLKNTAEYWKIPRCQTYRMHEDYGPATFFLTLSPADYDDKELEAYLRTVNGKEANEKPLSALIAADPVSVSRFYDRKLHGMLKFLTQPDGPLGVVEHYFWRREYQSRGTVHFHILLWIKDAPVLGESSSEEVAAFIEDKITCAIPDKFKFPTLHQKVTKYQEHRCNPYCLRLKTFPNGAKKKICRFGFPRAVADKIILRDTSTAIAGKRNLMANARLYDLPRKKTEVTINDYNSAILLAWTGNMDLQYTGEHTMQIAKYVTKYQTKPEKGHIADDFFDAANSTKSLRSNLWNLGMRRLSTREAGANEAADTLLGLPLYGTDKNTTFAWVDVGMYRSRKAKSKEEVDKLEDNDSVFCPSVIDTHYPNRPAEMEAVCLYDYVKDWDIIKKEPKKEDKSKGEKGEEAKKKEVPTYYKYSNFGFLRKRELRLEPPLHPHLINHYRIDPNQKPEEYYYSLLLLFKTWRKLDDLKGSHATFTEAFNAEKDSLPRAVQYHETRAKIQAAKEKIDKQIEEKSNEFQEKEPDEPNEDNIRFEAREATEAMHDFRAAAQEGEEEDLASLERQLNTDQHRVYEKVKEAILAGKPFRHFVSGVGGTGKSFLIKVITLWVRQTLKKDVAISAPTGIAAFNINGFTIHKLLQLPVEHDNKPLKYTRLADSVLNVLRLELKNVALFIIDEISMVSNVTLMMIHLRLCEIFDTWDTESAFFGGIPMLVFGDLLQLAPVRSHPAFEGITKQEGEKHFSTASGFNLWKELFTYDELQINMRQKDDKSFQQLLDNIRLGLCSQENLNTLLSCRISEIDEGSPDDRLQKLSKFVLEHTQKPVCLMPTRLMCDRLNRSILSMLPKKEEIVLVARDSVDCKLSERDKAAKTLKKTEDNCSNTAGLEKVIVVKEGARIMLRRNIDVTKGYVNGATGTVVSVKKDIHGSPVSMKIQMKDGILDLTPAESKFQILPGIFVYRKQFAIMLAYAITMHKSQGLSLDAVLLDIGNQIFAAGQIYVALSRVKTLKGLFIINFDPEKVKAHTKALREYVRLRSTVPHLMAKAKEVVRRSKNPPKIPDRQWGIFDKKVSVDVNPPSAQKAKPSSALMPVFENADKLSSYANATLQCLLSYEPLRSDVRRSAGDYALKTTANEFSLKKKKLTAMNVRKEVGAPFNQRMQQDPAEFLKVLIGGNEILQRTTKFTEVRTRQCLTCKNESAETVITHILRLPLVPNEKSILRLMEKHFKKSPRDSVICGVCSKECLHQEGTTVRDTSDILIIQFELQETVGGQNAKITDFRVNSLSTTRITVDGHRYELHSALFYHGPNIEHGHFTAIVRSDKFIWADDDEIKVTQWPKGSADVYLLFYKKITAGVKPTKVPTKPPQEGKKQPPTNPKTTASTITERPKGQPVKKKASERHNIIPVAMTEEIHNRTASLPLPGFKNVRNNCYANASLQCLLSYEPLRENLSRSAGIFYPLQHIANKFYYPGAMLSADGLRILAGPPFSGSGQQDPQEFIGVLINNCETLQEKTKFTEARLRTCGTCGRESVHSQCHYFLQLPATSRERSISQILANELLWSEIEGSICSDEPDGCKGTLREQLAIQHTNDIIIVQFILYTNEGNKITNFRVDNLPSTILTVGGIDYELYSAVFHKGETTKCGHYTAIVRSGGTFFLADDTKISECEWPSNGEGAYLLFYRRRA